MVHENIFRLASPLHFFWIFTVNYAPIGDGIVISLGHGALQRARKGTRKKERESKNLKNSETHVVPYITNVARGLRCLYRRNVVPDDKAKSFI